MRKCLPLGIGLLTLVPLLNISVDLRLPIGIQSFPEGRLGGECRGSFLAKGSEVVGVDGRR